MIVLETERLLLKEVTPELFGYMLTYKSDEEIKAFFDFDDKALSIARERSSKGLSSYQVTYCYFMLCDKESGTTIGSCGFYRMSPEHHRGEIGYNMSNEAYKRKGLMSEAAARILQYGFDTLQLNRIEAFASPENEASLKILAKLGMKYEGLMRGHFLKNGVYEDSACYAVLKEEYVA